jgi:predicted nuclease of predicted toxin-antitoxin system
VSLFASLYLDENVDVLVAKLLRARGFDAVTAHERSTLGITDPEQLALAIAEGRALVTHNREHFVALHTEYLLSNQPHMGILITAMRRPGEVANRLAHVLDTFTADEIANQLLYV